MELRRIDNLWKFLGIKNNITVNNVLDDGMKYRLSKAGLEMIHHINPHFLQQSSLLMMERNFQEKLNYQHYSAHKLRFGHKSKSHSAATNVVFFPKALLTLNHKYDLEIQKDRSGHFKVRISPFIPKNVYDILDAVNLISRILWKKNFFAEGIRN